MKDATLTKFRALTPGHRRVAMGMIALGFPFFMVFFVLGTFVCAIGKAFRDTYLEAAIAIDDFRADWKLIAHPNEERQP